MLGIMLYYMPHITNIVICCQIRRPNFGWLVMGVCVGVILVTIQQSTGRGGGSGYTLLRCNGIPSVALLVSVWMGVYVGTGVGTICRWLGNVGTLGTSGGRVTVVVVVGGGGTLGISVNWKQLRWFLRESER